MANQRASDPSLQSASFIGDVETKWVVDSWDADRDMELLKDFAFHVGGDTWKAIAGETVNGASIPPILWSVVGSPFVGDYRRASVIHDVYSEYEGKVPWEQTSGQSPRIRSSYDVHKMFFLAMLADGTEVRQACLMYVAVALFRPRWPSDGYVPSKVPPMSLADVERIKGAVSDVVESGVPLEYAALEKRLAERFRLPR